jgi:hypothetical protein
VLAQTPDQDLWLTERAFERAITMKQHDAARPVFHADFLGVDADAQRTPLTPTLYAGLRRVCSSTLRTSPIQAAAS